MKKKGTKRQSRQGHLTILQDLLMVGLAVLSVFLLVSEVVFHLNAQQQRYLQYVDFGIALAFLGDFLVQFDRAKDKRRFWKSSWWELLAAIPLTNHFTLLLRGFKLGRVEAILRALRLGIRLDMLSRAAKRYTRESLVVYLAIVVSAIILLCAAGFQYFELGTNPNLHTYWDSLYYTVTAMATVGSNITPVTTGGRLMTLLMILLGIGAMGSFVTALGGFIVGEREE